jgi:hypothetical protein
MKRKHSLKRRVSLRSKKALSSKLTLEQVVEAAHAAGAHVTFSLVPHEAPAPAPVAVPAPVPEPEKSKHGIPSPQWPGDPTCRSIMAYDADDAAIAKEFKSEPTSRWVITPYRIVERSQFFSPKPARTPEGEQVETVNPS